MEQWISGTFKSAVGQNNNLEHTRKALVTNALRFEQKGTKNKDVENPYDSTEFKPFSIRELEYDIWDSKTTNNMRSSNVINRLHPGEFDQQAREF